MKEIVYVSIDNGSDGRGPSRVVYASVNESERDEWHDLSPSRDYLRKSEEIVDFDQEAYEVWCRLTPIQKMALLRTSCPMWQADYKDKGVGACEVSKPVA